MKILSIDAWAEGDGWVWNNWYSVGETDTPIENEEQAFDVFEVYFGNTIRQSHEVEDDQYNFVLVEKETRKPLFAVEYGSE